MVPGQAIRPKTPFPARGLVSTLALATFVNHLNVIAWIPFLPFIAEAHGISVSLLWQIPALMLLLSAFLGLVIGPLADRSGYRRTLFVCLLAVVASSLSTGLAVTLSVLFLAALFGAIGRAAVMPVAQATAASLFMENTARRRAISRIQSGGPLAATLGIPLLTTIAMASLAGRIHRCFGAGTWDSAHPPKDARPRRNYEQRGAQNRVADFSQIEG